MVYCTSMKVGETIRRTSPWGDVVIRDIASQEELNNYRDMQKTGFDLEVLVGGKWERVPKVIAIKSPPEGCASCEA